MLGLQTCWAMSIRSRWVRGDRVCVLPMCRDSSVEKPEGKGSPGVGWRRQPSQRLTVPVPSPGLTRMLTCPQRTSLCKFKFQRKDLRVSLQQVPKDTAWERAPKQGMPPVCPLSFLLLTHQGFFHPQKNKTCMPSSLSLRTFKWSPTLC